MDNRYEWIDVKDRVPEEPGEYLLYYWNQFIETGKWDGENFTIYALTTKNTVNPLQDPVMVPYQKVINATHWMPKPEAPVSDEESWGKEAIDIVIEMAMESGRSHPSGEKPPPFYMLPERTFKRVLNLATRIYAKERHGVRIQERE